jgi:hypothetical protein
MSAMRAAETAALRRMNLVLEKFAGDLGFG